MQSHPGSCSTGSAADFEPWSYLRGRCAITNDVQIYAASNSFFGSGLEFVVLGVVWSLLALGVWLRDKKKDTEERERIEKTWYGMQGVLLRFLGPVALVVGVVMLAINCFK